MPAVLFSFHHFTFFFFALLHVAPCDILIMRIYSTSAVLRLLGTMIHVPYIYILVFFFRGSTRRTPIRVESCLMTCHIVFFPAASCSVVQRSVVIRRELAPPQHLCGRDVGERGGRRREVLLGCCLPPVSLYFAIEMCFSSGDRQTTAAHFVQKAAEHCCCKIRRRGTGKTNTLVCLFIE